MQIHRVTHARTRHEYAFRHSNTRMNDNTTAAVNGKGRPLSRYANPDDTFMGMPAAKVFSGVNLVGIASTRHTPSPD